MGETDGSEIREQYISQLTLIDNLRRIVAENSGANTETAKDQLALIEQIAYLQNSEMAVKKAAEDMTLAAEKIRRGGGEARVNITLPDFKTQAQDYLCDQRERPYIFRSPYDQLEGLNENLLSNPDSPSFSIDLILLAEVANLVGGVLVVVEREAGSPELQYSFPKSIMSGDSTDQGTFEGYIDITSAVADRLKAGGVDKLTGLVLPKINPGISIAG